MRKCVFFFAVGRCLCSACFVIFASKSLWFQLQFQFHFLPTQQWHTNSISIKGMRIVILKIDAQTREKTEHKKKIQSLDLNSNYEASCGDLRDNTLKNAYLIACIVHRSNLIAGLSQKLCRCRDFSDYHRTLSPFTRQQTIRVSLSLYSLFCKQKIVFAGKCAQWRALR